MTIKVDQVKHYISKKERIEIAKSQIQTDLDRRNAFNLIFKWTFLAVLIGISAGIASSLFLYSLEIVTSARMQFNWLIFLLPIGGLLTGFLYFYFGKEVEKGNSLLLESIENSEKRIPFKMAPLVYLGTILSHLLGASAGREGTALQMSAALSEQITQPFRIPPDSRKIMIRAAIAAGFGSVFGTPFAGIVFAFEILIKKDWTRISVWTVTVAALVADFTTDFFGPNHTLYSIGKIPEFSLKNLFFLILVGILFGVCSWLFMRSMETSKHVFRLIKFPPLRPFLGGFLIVGAVFLFGTTDYLGLGIEQIVGSFESPSNSLSFLIKLGLTVLTISSGFKGGEVTPLFFIGATLGSTLSMIIPFPTAFLAGMGFVAVFAGATKTPIASSVLAIEIFGIEAGIFAMLVCWVAFYASGKKSIYTS